MKTAYRYAFLQVLSRLYLQIFRKTMKLLQRMQKQLLPANATISFYASVNAFN
nr:MAG TPA: hypothetical protein [Caudoviricetes sp.]